MSMLHVPRADGVDDVGRRLILWPDDDITIGRSGDDIIIQTESQWRNQLWNRKISLQRRGKIL